MYELDIRGNWRIGLAGDWHGNKDWARHALRDFNVRGIDVVFQLGDFGLGFPPIPAFNQYLSEVTGACIKNDIQLYIVPGNHENYDWMDENLVYGDNGIASINEHVHVLERGFRAVLGDRTLVALGGAPSIDYPHRVMGRSWWPQEQISLEEAEAVAAGGHADIMLAHDSPNMGTQEVIDIVNTPQHISMWTTKGLNYAAEGRKLMDIAYYGVLPKFFAHGHYHTYGTRYDDPTFFASLHCDGFGYNTGILDLTDLSFSFVKDIFDTFIPEAVDE